MPQLLGSQRIQRQLSGTLMKVYEFIVGAGALLVATAAVSAPLFGLIVLASL